MRVQGRQPIDVEVTYRRPVLVKTKLGEMPQDYHSYSSHRDQYFTRCDEGACDRGGQSVWRQTPLYESDGSPRLETVTERIVAYPANPWVEGAKWGLVGVAAGGLVGAVASLAGGFDLRTAAGLGAGVGALAGGGFGAQYALGDQIRLEWQETPILEKTMTGYYHDVDSRYTQRCGYDWDGEWRCRDEHDGYDHEFRAQVDNTRVGSYSAPVVVHYRDGEVMK